MFVSIYFNLLHYESWIRKPDPDLLMYDIQNTVNLKTNSLTFPDYYINKIKHNTRERLTYWTYSAQSKKNATRCIRGSLTIDTASHEQLTWRQMKSACELFTVQFLMIVFKCVRALNLSIFKIKLDSTMIVINKRQSSKLNFTVI